MTKQINEPYSTMSRIIDAVFNFLTAVGVIAFAGVVGYFYARFL
jgi:hypothetical protein